MLSIVVPTFNRREFIAAAINSIIIQGYNDAEIIIVDDRSTDDTHLVVRELQQRYPNIIYLINQRAKGPSGARNTGILNSNGNLIAFLDSDDVWLPNYLSLAEEVFRENEDIDVLFSNFYKKDFDTNQVISDFLSDNHFLAEIKGTVVNDNVFKISGDIFSALIQNNFFNICGAVFRKSILKDILLSEKHWYSEDCDIAIRLALDKNAVFGCRMEPAFVQYRHNNNMCNGNRRILDNIRMNADQLDLFTLYYNNYTLTVNQKKHLVNAINTSINNLLWGYRRTFNIPKFINTYLLKRKFNLF